MITIVYVGEESRALSSWLKSNIPYAPKINTSEKGLRDYLALLIPSTVKMELGDGSRVLANDDIILVTHTLDQLELAPYIEPALAFGLDIRFMFCSPPTVQEWPEHWMEIPRLNQHERG